MPLARDFKRSVAPRIGGGLAPDISLETPALGRFFGPSGDARRTFLNVCGRAADRRTGGSRCRSPAVVSSKPAGPVSAGRAICRPGKKLRRVCRRGAGQGPVRVDLPPARLDFSASPSWTFARVKLTSKDVSWLLVGPYPSWPRYPIETGFCPVAGPARDTPPIHPECFFSSAKNRHQ